MNLFYVYVREPGICLQQIIQDFYVLDVIRGVHPDTSIADSDVEHHMETEAARQLPKRLIRLILYM